MRPAPILLALLLAAAPAAAGPEDEVAAARGEFEAIVKEVAAEVRTPHGDSLTKLVHDFVSHDARVVHDVEAAAWRGHRHGIREGLSMAPPVEQVIRFLHGLKRRGDPGMVWYGERPGLEVVAGAVVLRAASGGGGSGPGIGELDVPFEKLVEGTEVRAFPLPKAEDLVAVDVPEDRGMDEPHWSDSAVIDFGMALGEACATDDDAFQKLLARAMSRPTSRCLFLALGWSSRPEAREFLSHVLGDLSAKGWRRSPYAWIPSPIDSTVTALRHADEKAYDRALKSLSDVQRFRVVGTPSVAEILRNRLAAVDAASGADAHRAALLHLCDTVRSLGELPSGADGSAVLHVMLDCLGGNDEALRTEALGTAQRLLAGATHVRTVLFTLRSPTGTRSDEGEVLGALAGPEAALRQLVADVDAGRIVLGEPDPAEPQRARVTDGDRARSDVPQDLFMGGDPAIAPVRVSAWWKGTSLHVCIVNESRGALAVDPVSIRYGLAEKVVVTTTLAGEVPKAQTRHRLALGRFWPCCAVAANCVVVLRPGATFECDVPVSGELRGTPPVDICVDGPPVLGSPDSAPIVRFGWTRVL